MLDQLRRGAGSWAAKILIGLLVMAFAVWGIADIFRGFTAQTVATVGDKEIPLARFQSDFNAQLRELSRRIGKPLTPAEGRQYGIDRQVMARLIGVAALDVEADELALAVSDEMVAASIAADPDLQGPFGRVDPATIRQLLQRNGISEEQFLNDRRSYLTRKQLLEAVKAGTHAPATIAEAIYRYQNEQRIPAYLILPPEAVGEIATPDEAVIADYHRQAAVRFTRPERRSLTLLMLNPGDLAASVEIPEEELRAEYDKRRDQYDTPEQRTIDQIPFAKLEDAKRAVERLRQGESFEKVVTEQGLTLKDVALGTVTRRDLLSTEIADTAFALKIGSISDPVAGPLGPVVLRVTAITPGISKSYEDTRAELLQALKDEKARDEVFDVQNSIEDARAGGTSLEEVAQKFNLHLIEIDKVTDQGLDTAGVRPADLPDIPGLLELAFASDVGLEIDPGETEEGGYYWLHVDEVVPAELKPLDEVRDEVIALWKREKRKLEMEKLAASLVDRANAGENFDATAATYGRAVLTAPALNRQASNETFSRVAVAALFAVPEGKFAYGPVGFGDGLILMQVKKVLTPSAAANPGAVAELATNISQTLQGDLVTSMVAGVQEKVGVEINSRLVSAMFANAEDQGGASF